MADANPPADARSEADAAGATDAPEPTTAAEPTPTADPIKPYRGLVPFTEREAEFFFGRERERQLITSNLRASRLTLVYGASGVGKTSVLKAGVVHHLRRIARKSWREQGNPKVVVVEFASWAGDPVAEIPAAVDSAVRAILGDAAPPAPISAGHLDEVLHAWTERLDCVLLVILDQFDEYFLYHADESGEGTFAADLPRALGRRDLRANFLISIREDSYSKLDRFKDEIRNLYGNYLRIDHLDRAGARDATLKPLEHYNRLQPTGTPPVSIEPALVDGVLDAVAAGQVKVGQVGAGTVGEAAPSDALIEAPYLQLVMSRLWDEERASGSDVLRLTTFERLGGAGQIVGSHLDNAMSALSDADREVAFRVLRFLVTPDGTKIAHTAGDLAEFAEVPQEQLDRVLDHLAGGSTLILRREAVPGRDARVRYELFHDVLGPAILDWRARYRELRRRAEAEARLADERRQADERLEQERADVERQRREAEAKVRAARRRTLGLAGVAVAFAALAVGVFAFSRVAEANRFTAQALTGSETDPDTAVLDALSSLDTWGTPEAEDALRIAMSHTHLSGTRHGDVVWSAAFAPDGARFVSASEDGTARVVDTETGETIHTLAGHDDAVTGAAFSPDGRLVVTASRDMTARVWDAESGEERFTLTHDAEAYLASSDLVAPDGAYIATGAFSADGSMLVTIAGSAAWVWDLATGEQIDRLDHPDLAVFTASFSPDGGLIATGANDGQARIWDAATGSLSVDPPLDNITNYVAASVFSPDGRFLATGNSDGSLGLWEAETGAVIFLSPHTHTVASVSFSADGTRLLSAGDKTAVIYDVSEIPDDLTDYEVPLVSVINARASWIDAARFSPDGRYVVTSNQDSTARVFETETGDQLLTFRGHDNIVWSAIPSPDGRRVLTASEDGTARVWAVGADVELLGHTFAVSSAMLGPDGSVLTASVDATAGIWDSETGDRLHSLVGEDPQEADPVEYGFWPMSTAEFSTDGTRIVTAQTGPTSGVAIWDPAAPETPLATCCANDFGDAWGAGFYPGSTDRVVVGYEDGTVRVWDTADDAAGTELHVFDEGNVIGFAISSDASIIVTVGRDDEMARAWDAETFELGRAWSVGLASGVALSPDGGRAATIGLDHTVRVWEVASGDEAILQLTGPTAAVTAVNFSSDGAWVLAGDAAGSTWIWDGAGGGLLGVMHLHADGVNAVATDDDGRILTASEDGTAKITRCEVCGPIETVIERARALTASPAPSPAP
jgi:WD40 repeat protein